MGGALVVRDRAHECVHVNVTFLDQELVGAGARYVGYEGACLSTLNSSPAHAVLGGGSGQIFVCQSDTLPLTIVSITGRGGAGWLALLNPMNPIGCLDIDPLDFGVARLQSSKNQRSTRCVSAINALPYVQGQGHHHQAALFTKLVGETIDLGTNIRR